MGLVRNVRIAVLWKHSDIELEVLCKNAQFIHCHIKHRDGKFCGFVTFIYAFNNVGERKMLWDHLLGYSTSITKPWLLIGNYNVVLNAEEKIKENGESPDTSSELEEFMQEASLVDLRAYGCRYTWTNSHVHCKLDRALVNESWQQSIFYGISDHSPILVHLGEEHVCRRGIF